ncbi:ABC transporter substrate-binding protein [Anaerotignum faecicola]|nr:ABC transporter substrate-binding protein [Anaerotignum faecicola]
MIKKLLALLISSSFIFAACSPQGGSEGQNAETPNGESTQDNKTGSVQELEDFEVVLDWYPNAVHSFIYEAIENGYYAEEGLNVIIRFPSNTNDAISLTAAGKADMGIYYMHDIIRAKGDQDIPVKSVGAITQEPLNIFLSLKDKNITEPKDLIGKKIGQSGSDLSEAIIRVMVEGAGGSMDDVEVIDVGFDLMSSMTTGNVDATIGCMVNHEVPELEDEGFEVNYFYPNEYGMPDYYELVFVTGEKNLEENRDKIEGFLRASAKGFEDMKKDPAGAVKLLLENQNAENFPLKENVEMQSIETLLPVMETENAKFLSQDKAVWEENINWLLQQGILENPVSAEDVYEDIIG